MSTLAIGKRNIRGTVEGVTRTPEESGYEVETFGPLALTPTEWVSIEPLSGTEGITAQQVFGQTTARLRMRYRPDLTEAMQFVTDDGETWVFKSPPMDPDGRKRELEVLVVQGD